MPHLGSIAAIAAGLGAMALAACQPRAPSATGISPATALIGDPSAARQDAAATVAAPYPPPPARAEIPPPDLLPGSLWQFGHWTWDGARYLWTPGRYIERPSPDANWLPGYWRQQADGWVWVDGRWSS
jgi:YXWGXW repeat-containing protein